MRTLRSTKLRADLYLCQGGKCNLCGCFLNKGWHVDHIIPYCIKKCTEIDNLQGLCPQCNLRKGKKMKGLYQFFNLNAGRPGQQEALKKIKSRVELFVETKDAKYQTTSIVLPTRYGKSDVMRLAAIEMKAAGLVCLSILAAPVVFLRDQLSDSDKIESMMKRWGINREVEFCKIPTFHLPLVQNSEDFVTMTTQMLSINKDEIAKYVKQMVKKTGKPVAVFVDEVHSMSEANSWGASVPAIMDAGGIVILLTATPERSDGKKMYGFFYDEIPYKIVKSVVPSNKPHEDEDKIWMDEYTKMMGKIKIVPDYQYSFKQAWDEGNVICKLTRQSINVEIEIKEDEIKKLINEFSISESSKYLTKICRNHLVIDKGVEMALNSLRIRRITNPDTVCICFCGNDFEDEDCNAHAKSISKAFRDKNPSIKVVIATSTSEDEGNEAIKRFANGEGDVLIVKQMASLGLDIPAIKVALDLSSVRKPAAWIQKSMRPATIWKNVNTADLIMPDDVISRKLFQQLIGDQGGEYQLRTLSQEKIGEYETELSDDQKKNVEITNVTNGVISDHKGDYSQNIDEDIVFYDEMCKSCPGLINIMTAPEMIVLAKQMAQIGMAKLSSETAAKRVPETQKPTQTLDTNAKAKDIRNQINEQARKYAFSNYDYENDYEGWKKGLAKIQFEAKNYAGINGELGLSMDIKSLKKMLQFLKEMNLVSTM